MALRNKLDRLEKAARGKFAWLELPDGSKFYYDPECTAAEVFLFAANLLRATCQGDPLPDPPQVLRLVGSLPTREDREQALWAVYGTGGKPFIAHDVERFVASGEIKPARWIKRPGDDRDRGLDGREPEVRLGPPPS